MPSKINLKNIRKIIKIVLNFLKLTKINSQNISKGLHSPTEKSIINLLQEIRDRV